MTLIERINSAGTTVIMATHDRGIVDRMQKRVVELSGGEILRDQRSAGYQKLSTGSNKIVDSALTNTSAQKVIETISFFQDEDEVR
jgi:energy-coupling factor transporter ATP-binding protein EcfA2